MKKLLMVIPLVFLLCLTFGCQQGEEGITEEEAKALFDRDLRIWNDGNLDIVDEIIAPNYVIYSDPHDPYENQTLDHNTYKKRVLDFRTAYPDIQFTLEDIIAKGDKVLTRWTLRGTDKPRGKPFAVTGMTIYHIVGGKLKGHWQNWDRFGFYQQLGFTLTPPQSPETPEEKKQLIRNQISYRRIR